MKICNKCRVIKDIVDYNRRRDNKLRSRCRDCEKDDCREYKLRNKDKIKAYTKKYCDGPRQEYRIKKGLIRKMLNI